MRINCGPTKSEKRAALKEWHLWFAWRPVRVGSNDCRWLEMVGRKGTVQYLPPGVWCGSPSWWKWDYIPADQVRGR